MLRRTLLWILASGGGLPCPILAARADPTSAAIAAGEPPLSEILKRLGYTIDTDHDEIDAPLFVRAGPGLVTHRPIAAYGVPNRCSSGWYRPTEGAPRPETLWVIDSNHNKQDLPPVMPGGRTDFDPGGTPFGLWVSSSGFKNETVYTEDALQRFVLRFKTNDRHKAHVFAVKKSAQVVHDQYVIGWEYSTNNDDQDVVTLITNVQPASTTGSP